MNWITHGIAIGSIRDAQDVRYLATEHVEAVLRLLDEGELEEPPYFRAQLRLPVADGRPLDPTLLRRGVDFIREQRQAGRKVLVHCGLGQSRSPSFVAAYLHEEGATLPDAFLLIQRMRSETLPHPELVRSLFQYYSLPDDPTALIVKLVQARRMAAGRRAPHDA